MHPTPDDITKAKAAAGASPAFALAFDAFDLEVLFRDLTFDEFAEFLDVSRKRPTDGTSYAVTKCLLWPAEEQAGAVMPAFSQEFARAVKQRKGVVDGEASVVTAPDRDKLIAAGVPDTVADELVKQHGKGLALVRRSTGDVRYTIAITRPSFEAYEAAKDGIDQARTSGVGFFAVAFAAVQDSVAWSKDLPFAELVNKWPGIVTNDLLEEVLNLGGLLAKRSIKSL
jgi:hypothetical protein